MLWNKNNIKFLPDLSFPLSPPLSKPAYVTLISESWSARQDKERQKLENELQLQKEQTKTLVEKNEAVQKQLSEKGTFQSRH